MEGMCHHFILGESKNPHPACMLYHGNTCSCDSTCDIIWMWDEDQLSPSSKTNTLLAAGKLTREIT